MHVSMDRWGWRACSSEVELEMALLPSSFQIPLLEDAEHLCLSICETGICIAVDQVCWCFKGDCFKAGLVAVWTRTDISGAEGETSSKVLGPLTHPALHGIIA